MRKKNTRVASLRLVTTLALAVAGICGSMATARAADFFDTFDYTTPAEMQAVWGGGVPDWATFDSVGVTLDLPAQGENRTITSNWTGAFGTYTAKFNTTNTGGNQVWFGWRNRDPWSSPAVYVSMWDSFYLCVNNGGPQSSSISTPYVTPGEWHTISIDWQPTFVELIYDGTSCGQVTDASVIPQAALPLAMDSYRGTADPLVLKFDEVSVTSNSAPVPEPSSMMVLLFGLGGVAGFAKKRLTK